MTEETFTRGEELLKLIESKKKELKEFNQYTKAKPLVLGYIAGRNFIKVREATKEETENERQRIDAELKKLEDEFAAL